MRKLQFFVVISAILTSLFLITGCEGREITLEQAVKPPTNGYTLTGEWHEVNSTHDWGTKVIFTDTTMSIIGYGVFALEPDKEPIWHDTLLIYTQDLAYKVLSDNELEFAYRPPACIELPNYKVNYTFKSADTLFVEKIWANSATSVYPPLVSDILLSRRKGNNE